MKLVNKFPGKDISQEDIKTKFPLVAKKNKNHKCPIQKNLGIGPTCFFFCVVQKLGRVIRNKLLPHTQLI